MFYDFEIILLWHITEKKQSKYHDSMENCIIMLYNFSKH
jgi:hypothetical protein